MSNSHSTNSGSKTSIQAICPCDWCTSSIYGLLLALLFLLAENTDLVLADTKDHGNKHKSRLSESVPQGLQRKSYNKVQALLGDVNGENMDEKTDGFGVEARILQNEDDIESWIQLGGDIDGEATYDRSGSAVSLSSDGTIMAIGAYRNVNANGSDSGHVRVYQYNNGTWTQLGGDIDGEAQYDLSGSAVSLSSDGTILAVGAPYNDNANGSQAGHIRVYELSGTPTSCQETGTDHFYAFKYQGTSHRRTCNWLKNRSNERRIRNLCVQSEGGTDGGTEYPPARDVCVETCAAYEYARTFDKNGKKKKCGWLMRRNPSVKANICATNEEAKRACQVTCDFCPL